MITLHDYFQGRDTQYASELTEEMIGNASVTVDRANLLLSYYYQAHPDADRPTVSSGWRPAAINRATPGAAVRSKHMSCEAIDLADPDGLLDDWCIEHPSKLEAVGIWAEHPSSTKGWAHWQIVPPKSGRRFFYP